MARAHITVVCTALLGLACQRTDTPTPPGPTVRPASEVALAAPLVRLTGGAAEGDRLPMIVAIHGLGDTPEGFSGVMASYPLPARVVLPGGPHPAGAGGRSWFEVRTRGVRGIWISEPELIASTDRIAALVRRLLEDYPTEGKPVVTGFSQGGILSFSLAVRHPDLFCLAVPISGLLPEALRPGSGQPTARSPRIRALHGSDDELVPVPAAQASVAHLQRIGLDASLEEFEGVGHRMPEPVRSALYRLLAQGCSQE